MANALTEGIVNRYNQNKKTAGLSQADYAALTRIPARTAAPAPPKQTPRASPTPGKGGPYNENDMPRAAPTPTPSPAPTGQGGGGGGDDRAPAAAPIDWEAYLTNFGFPADVVAQIKSIFSSNSDPATAALLAQRYIRGTPWFATAFPGFQEGVNKGFIRDERDYMSRRNEFQQVYKQYAGRDVTLDEFAGHLREGVGADVVGKRFEGAAYASTYGNDWQYLLGAFGEGRASSEELKAGGEQQAGLSSPLGMKLQQRLSQAQQRIQAVFSGNLALGQLKLPDANRRADISA